MKQQIINHIDGIQEDLFALSTALYESHSQSDILKKIQDLLEQQGFECRKIPLNGSFVMEGKIQQGRGPRVGYFYRYSLGSKPMDRWNISVATPMSIGTVLGLGSVMKELEGSIVLLGCSWDRENYFVEEDLLKELDAGIFLKAGKNNCESGCSANIRHLQVDFEGKPSSPGQQGNALHGIIQCFNGVFALSQSLPSSAQVGGVIVNGGQFPEEVPRNATGEFSISCGQEKILDEIIGRIMDCAKGAARQTGTKVTLKEKEIRYDSFSSNQVLNRLFCHNLKEIGLIDIHGPEENLIPIKSGNVSRQIPSIFPCIGLQGISPWEDIQTRVKGKLPSEVKKIILKGSQAAAFTGLDLLSNKNLCKDIKRGFKREAN